MVERHFCDPCEKQFNNKSLFDRHCLTPAHANAVKVYTAKSDKCVAESTRLPVEHNEQAPLDAEETPKTPAASRTGTALKRTPTQKRKATVDVVAPAKSDSTDLTNISPKRTRSRGNVVTAPSERGASTNDTSSEDSDDSSCVDTVRRWPDQRECTLCGEVLKDQPLLDEHMMIEHAPAAPKRLPSPGRFMRLVQAQLKHKPVQQEDNGEHVTVVVPAVGERSDTPPSALASELRQVGCACAHE